MFKSSGSPRSFLVLTIKASRVPFGTQAFNFSLVPLLLVDSRLYSILFGLWFPRMKGKISYTPRISNSTDQHTIQYSAIMVEGGSMSKVAEGASGATEKNLE